MLHEQAILKEPRDCPEAQLHSAISGLAVAEEMTIGMVTNPHSGGNRKGIGPVREFLARHPDIHHGEAVTPEEVEALLADFSARNVNLLIVNGGDGTVQAVLTALYGDGRRLFSHPPVLALLRAGTMSMLARDVGVQAEQAAALAKIRAWSATSERRADLIHPRPVLKVRRAGEQKALCGMFFGAGAILGGIELYHERVNPHGVRGELMPGLILLRILLAILMREEKLVAPTEMGMCVNGSSPRRIACLAALVSTLERLFLGLHPFWGKETAPLHFTAVKVKAPHLWRSLPFLLRGIPTAAATPDNGFFSHNAGHVALEFRGRFTLDGELFAARGTLTIEPAGPALFLRL